MECSRSWSVWLCVGVLPLLAVGCHRESDQPPPSPSSSAQQGVADASSAVAAVEAGTDSGQAPRGLAGLGDLSAPLRNEEPSPRDSGLANTTVTVDVALPPAPQMPDAEKVLRHALPPARMCYERGLSLGADTARGGELTLRVTVGTTGEVETVDVTASKGVASDTTACVAAATKRLKFPAPADGNRATLQPKLTFTVAGR